MLAYSSMYMYNAYCVHILVQSSTGVCACPDIQALTAFVRTNIKIYIPFVISVIFFLNEPSSEAFCFTRQNNERKKNESKKKTIKYNKREFSEWNNINIRQFALHVTFNEMLTQTHFFLNLFKIILFWKFQSHPFEWMDDTAPQHQNSIKCNVV